MFNVSTLLVLVTGLPLLAALVTAVLGKKVLGERSHWPVVVGIGLSCVASIALLFVVRSDAVSDKSHETHGEIGYELTVPLWTWAVVENAYEQPTAEGESIARDFRIEVVLRADPLTSIMLLTVTFVSFLVAVYSIGYMHDDPGYWRFFSYIGLFVFAMTMLVSVSNFLLLYVFWEAVGLCSYLLIGFWFEKPEAAAAGKKAFLVNRIGDFGFALGLFFLWTTYGTLNFHDTLAADGTLVSAGVLGQTMLSNPSLYVGGGVATAICLLLLLGACGKSAQVPLHVWLPDAMEGPTPVSALIHAATMVTAGIYMITRCTPLFVASEHAKYVVAGVGCLTALLAAIIALTQTDLKRILAYSTISQLGYMFLGLGVGSVLGITAGMFHLFTHAFFKALLFLGAGSVMHAMGGVIDIREFGGLRRKMPWTHGTFLFGCLALAGFPLFAGFFSKDLILVAVSEASHGGAYGGYYLLLYITALVTALLTAFYTFRAYFRTFFGPEKIPHEAGHHAHESPVTMTGPLVILAVCSLVVGGLMEWTGWFEGFLEQTPSLAFLAHASHGAHAAEGGSHLGVMILSSIVAVVGILAAAVCYLGNRTLVNTLKRPMDAAGLYGLSHGKLFFDPIYNLLFVWPLLGFAFFCAFVDRFLVDGLVNLCGWIPRQVGSALRPLQGGLTQFYALAMALGLLVLTVALLIL